MKPLVIAAFLLSAAASFAAAAEGPILTTAEIENATAKTCLANATNINLDGTCPLTPTKGKSPKMKKGKLSLPKGAKRDKKLDIASDSYLLEHLPDITDEEVATALRCNACLAVAYEAFTAMNNANMYSRGRGKRGSLHGGVADSFEFSEALDGVCPLMKKQYGLLVDFNGQSDDERVVLEAAAAKEREKGTMDGPAATELARRRQAVESANRNGEHEFEVTTHWRNKQDARCITGTWVTPMINDQCHDIIASHEDKLIKAYKKDKGLWQFAAELCVEWHRVCTVSNLAGPETAAKPQQATTTDASTVTPTAQPSDPETLQTRTVTIDSATDSSAATHSTNTMKGASVSSHESQTTTKSTRDVSEEL